MKLRDVVEVVVLLMIGAAGGVLLEQGRRVEQPEPCRAVSSEMSVAPSEEELVLRRLQLELESS